MEEIKRIINNDYEVLYQYGSRVYGTAQVNSDFDYIKIQKENPQREAFLKQYLSECYDITFMTPQYFQSLLDNHNILALECYFLTKPVEYKGNWRFNLDLVKLRHSISEASSQSFVKAKKKFISPYEGIDNERERGKKSLFHSLRILNFGIQIATDGRIIDYSAANHIFEEIINNPSTNWEDYQKRWKPEFNKLSTEFKKLAPK